MTETRGRLSKAERVNEGTRVNVQRIGACGHTLNSDQGGSHFRCFCCQRGVNAVMSMSKGNACYDCFEPTELPKPVSFSNEVVVSQVIQACMFCNERATFCFADTGEPICERCVN